MAKKDLRTRQGDKSTFSELEEEPDGNTSDSSASSSEFSSRPSTSSASTDSTSMDSTRGLLKASGSGVVDASDLSKEWCKDIGDYYFQHKVCGTAVDYQGSANVKREVDALLTSEGKEALYKGLVKDNKAPLGYKSSTTHREAYLAYLAQVKLNGKWAEGEFEKSISMKKLLGKKGLLLYQNAIKEERNSVEFRNAVFLKSTERYAGPVWDEKLVLWVGGPSASGKSFGSQAVLSQLSERGDIRFKRDAQGRPIEGVNTIVAVDGGIERSMSQIRAMTLSVALGKGYKSISNLHKNTKLSVKGKVKAAATQTGMNLLIPDTFVSKVVTEPVLGKIKAGFKLFKKLNYKQVLSAMKGADLDTHRETVRQSGEMRAEMPQGSVFHEIGMRNQTLPVESKKYNPEHYGVGIVATEKAKSIFSEVVTGKPIILDVLSDLKFYVDPKKPEAKVAMCVRDHDLFQSVVHALPGELPSSTSAIGNASLRHPVVRERVGSLSDDLNTRNKVMSIVRAARPQLSQDKLKRLSSVIIENRGSLAAFGSALLREKLSAPPVIQEAPAGYNYQAQKPKAQGPSANSNSSDMNTQKVKKKGLNPRANSFLECLTSDGGPVNGVVNSVDPRKRPKAL